MNLSDEALSRAAGAFLIPGNRIKLLKDAAENYPAWTAAIEADFTAWLRQNIDRLPVARPQIEEILPGR